MARRLAIFLLFTVLLVGCESRQKMPELLAFSSLTPSDVSENDVIDLVARASMPGVSREARLVFEGDLHRPGRSPTRNQTIVVEGATVSPERVSLVMRPEVIERFTGRGEEAIHTTFRGTVRVEIPTETVALTGSLPGSITLDLRPRFVRRALEEERSRAGVEALSALGVEASAGAEGVRITSVVDGGPLGRAGILVGDRIVSVDAVRTLSVEDLAPSQTSSTVRFEIDRGAERLTMEVASAGFAADASRAMTIPFLLLSVATLLMLVFGSRLGGFVGILRHRIEAASRRFTHGERTLAAKLHLGPKSIASMGIVFLGASATFAAMPIAEARFGLELDVGILYLLSFMSLTTMTLLTSGGSSKGGVRERLRAFIAVVLCEIPAALALLHVVLIAGSLHLGELVASQAGPEGSLADTGGMPWFFHAFRRPQLFVLFVLFFAALLIEPKSQLLPSVKTFRSHAHDFARWGNVFVMCGLATAVFLGGWLVPGVPLLDHETKPFFLFLGTVLFLIKSWILTLAVMGARAVLPRLSPRHVPRLVLRVFLPIALVSIALTVAETRFIVLPRFRVLLSAISFALLVLLVSLVIADVIRKGSASRTYRLNTFL